jgi:hypothetical protein
MWLLLFAVEAGESAQGAAGAAARRRALPAEDAVADETEEAADQAGPEPHADPSVEDARDAEEDQPQEPQHRARQKHRCRFGELARQGRHGVHACGSADSALVVGSHSRHATPAAGGPDSNDRPATRRKVDRESFVTVR